MPLSSFYSNIFSIHYLLWFSGQTPVFGFLGNYVKYYANVSPGIYGAGNMVNYFLGLVVRSFFCSVADRRQAHRRFFIYFMILAFFAAISLTLLPIVLGEVQGNDLYKSRYALFFSIILCFNMATAVISCLTDAFAVNMSKKRNISYGSMRMYGTIGYASSSLAMIYIERFKPYLVPGLALTSTAIAADIIVTIFWRRADDFKLEESGSGTTLEDVMVQIEAQSKNRQDNKSKSPFIIDKNNQDILQDQSRVLVSNPNVSYGSTAMKDASASFIVEPNSNLSNDLPVEDKESHKLRQISDTQIQLVLFKYIARKRPSIFRYLFLFVICGALSALQWNYLFLYFEQIYQKDALYFSYIAMLAQSLLGELPFFILAQPIIDCIGRSHALSLSIGTIGLRYLTYAYLIPNASGYVLILTEIFQGPNFGLFYTALTSIGFDYSDCDGAILHAIDERLTTSDRDKVGKLRNSLRSLMMSVASSTYEGIGTGLGSFIGGVLFQSYGYERVWIGASVLAISVGMINSAVEYLKIPWFVDRRDEYISSRTDSS